MSPAEQRDCSTFRILTGVANNGIGIHIRPLKEVRHTDRKNRSCRESREGRTKTKKKLDAFKKNPFLVISRDELVTHAIKEEYLP